MALPTITCKTKMIEYSGSIVQWRATIHFHVPLHYKALYCTVKIYNDKDRQYGNRSIP